MKLRGFALLGVVLTVIHVTYSRECTYYPFGRTSVFADMAKSVNDFSLKLFKTALNNPAINGNFISSPLSVAMVLLMTSFGAQGRTSAELNRLIHAQKINECTVRTLTEELANYTNIELSLANKIFANMGTIIKTAFQNDVEFATYTKIENLDFTQSDEAVRKINDWCKNVTKSRIEELLQSGDVDESTVMVLVNAIYFRANWAKKFKKMSTNYLVFNSADGTKKNVPTMANEDNYRYGRLPEVSARFVELPYESKVVGDNVSMFIILPDAENGLSEVVKNIDKISLPNLFSANTTKVDIKMPIFSIESRFEVTNILMSMGMQEIFSESADFSGISDSKLKVSKVVQKAFLDVNENGSVAAAASGATMVYYIGTGDYEVFTVNRPFLVLIATKDIILFGGRVSDIKI